MPSLPAADLAQVKANAQFADGKEEPAPVRGAQKENCAGHRDCWRRTAGLRGAGGKVIRGVASSADLEARSAEHS